MKRHEINLNVCVDAVDAEQAKLFLQQMFFREATSEGKPYISHQEYVKVLLLDEENV